ncbi:hypothetical protein BDQ17DRAFT_1241177 [Cyathus striatus]|nr:hypothetical protein BDQ17DRAFT_1241177 [Cyathus striatus]
MSGLRLCIEALPLDAERAIKERWESSQHLLQNALSHIESEDHHHISEDNCEVLYGRAGLLYALLSLRSTHTRGTNVHHLYREAVGSLESLTSDETIDKVMHSIVRRGKYGASVYYQEVGDRHGIPLPPLMWAWHSKRYLGGAHGVAGILHVLLSCPANLLAKYIQDIVATVDWLIACQDKTGNWPSTAPGKQELQEDDPDEAGELIQWCHGAPGILILLATLIRRSKEADHEFWLSSTFEDKVHASISHGASIVYHHGLLRKGVGLCHGIAGSVFALLAAADASKETENHKYLSRALHLAHLATQHHAFTSEGSMRVPDHPWSLYEGMAGMCSAWGEVVSRMKVTGPRRCSGMPGYDDLE